MSILRDATFDNAACLLFIIGIVTIFLLQFESLLWNRGIFKMPGNSGPPELKPFQGFWIFPFNYLSAVQTDLLWIHVLIVALINAVLIDRFVARCGGGDVACPSWILSLRRLLAGVPVLGFCVIPGWRMIRNGQPKWMSRRTIPELKLESVPAESSRRQGRAFWGREELQTPASILWLLASNVYALRAGVAWLNAPQRATAAGLLAFQVVAIAVRCCGMVCTVAYTLERARKNDLWGKRKAALLFSAISWLLPEASFLLAGAALLMIGKRWFTAISDLRVGSLQARETNSDEFTRPDWSSRVVRQLLAGPPAAQSRTDDSTRKLLRFYREKTFLLMTEIASVMMIVLPLRARFPLPLTCLGACAALVYLAALVVLPVAAILQVWSVLRRHAAPPERAREHDQQLFSRFLLLTSMAVVGGFAFGVTAGRQDLKTLGFLLFWAGAYGSTIGFFLAFTSKDFSLALWPLLFVSMGLMGSQIQQSPELARLQLFKLYLMIPLVLLLTVAVGIHRCRWLLRPFRFRDLTSPLLSAGLRLRLAFLVVTACLPLGGLFIPVWIRLRAGFRQADLQSVFENVPNPSATKD